MVVFQQPAQTLDADVPVKQEWDRFEAAQIGLKVPSGKGRHGTAVGGDVARLPAWRGNTAVYKHAR